MKNKGKGSRIKRGSTQIPPGLQDGLIIFLDLVPARRLGQNLRKLLICFLRHEVEDGTDDNFDFYMKDLSNLFELLDTIEEEYDQSELFEPAGNKHG